MTKGNLLKELTEKDLSLNRNKHEQLIWIVKN